MSNEERLAINRRNGLVGFNEYYALSENPYTPSGIVPYSKKTFGVEQPLVNMDGELINGVEATSHNSHRDTLEFIKLFDGGRERIPSLSIAAIRMLFYMMKDLEPGKDYVSIDIPMFLAYFGYKENSKKIAWSALSELIHKEFIQKKEGTSGYYWINVNFFFNGVRTKLRIKNNNKDIKPI